MGDIRSYRDLIAWQQGMDLAVAIYEETKRWPKEEMYGLTSQVRRAATAVPSNIAEGYGRESVGAYLNFLRIARGSLREVETQLLLASRVGVAAVPNVDALLERADGVAKVLHGLIRKLEATS